MKKILENCLWGGVLLFSLSMSLTSCEGALDDILGEWSRPTPGSSTGGAVTSIGLDPDEMTLAVGDKGQLTAKVDPAGTAVTWSSDKEEIATVDANGLVTAVAMGTAIITAKAGDKTATCEVTVTPDLSTPLTVEAITAGTIKVTSPKAGMQYSLNGDAKQAVTTDAIPVAVGDKVAFYGNGISITKYSGTMIAGGTADIKVYGNIMSLVDETGFATLSDPITLPADDTFSKLFKDNAKLTDASGLLLPAMTLKDKCYEGMFYGCTSLTTAPAELPAMALKANCYQGMFYNCTNLAVAPKELPAPMLTGYCYSFMFYGCKVLTTAPKLPATTGNLATACYNNMFSGCTSLTTAYVKAEYTATGGACTNMFNGCTNAAGSTFYSKDAATADTWKSTFGLSSWASGVYPTE
ncbi:MAG: Ig-like domain-containing protein [Aeriscardovia sp.]|nr:Ig-like domain-containing protein [Aeriscardovia sp.]